MAGIDAVCFKNLLNSDKVPAVPTIVSYRVEDEGRAAEFKDLVHEVMAREDKRWTPAVWWVIHNEPEKIGYLGKDGERKWWETFRNNLTLEASQIEEKERKRVEDAAKAQARAERAEARRIAEKEKTAEEIMVMREQEINEAEADLPLSTDEAAEFLWVVTHPALRRASKGGSEQKVLITAEDILSAPNGKAPSRRAVTILDMSMDQTSSVLKMLIGQMIKKLSDQAGNQPTDDSDKDEVVDDTSKLQELLDKVAGAQSPSKK